MSIKNVNCVKDLLSVRYPEIRFSVTSKGACIVIGITASPYVWDSMYDVLDKEASSSGRSYKSAKKEMLKYWDKNRVSVVSVTPDVGFDFASFIASIRTVYEGELDIRLGSLFSKSRPRVLTEQQVQNRVNAEKREFSNLLQKSSNKLSEKESDTLRFGRVNRNSNAIRLKKSEAYY